MVDWPPLGGVSVSAAFGGVTLDADVDAAFVDGEEPVDVFTLVAEPLRWFCFLRLFFFFGGIFSDFSVSYRRSLYNFDGYFQNM